MKHGGSIESVIPAPTEVPNKVVFKLRLAGHEDLSVNPAAQLAAEIERQEKRYNKKKAIGAKKRQSTAPIAHGLHE